jgi:hypothetical protein
MHQRFDQILFQLDSHHRQMLDRFFEMTAQQIDMKKRLTLLDTTLNELAVSTGEAHQAMLREIQAHSKMIMQDLLKGEVIALESDLTGYWRETLRDVLSRNPSDLAVHLEILFEHLQPEQIQHRNAHFMASGAVNATTRVAIAKVRSGLFLLVPISRYIELCHTQHPNKKLTEPQLQTLQQLANGIHPEIVLMVGNKMQQLLRKYQEKKLAVDADVVQTYKKQLEQHEKLFKGLLQLLTDKTTLYLMLYRYQECCSALHAKLLQSAGRRATAQASSYALQAGLNTTRAAQQLYNTPLRQQFAAQKPPFTDGQTILNKLREGGFDKIRTTFDESLAPLSTSRAIVYRVRDENAYYMAQISSVNLAAIEQYTVLGYSVRYTGAHFEARSSGSQVLLIDYSLGNFLAHWHRHLVDIKQGFVAKAAGFMRYDAKYRMPTDDSSAAEYPILPLPDDILQLIPNEIHQVLQQWGGKIDFAYHLRDCQTQQASFVIRGYYTATATQVFTFYEFSLPFERLAKAWPTAVWLYWFGTQFITQKQKDAPFVNADYLRFSSNNHRDQSIAMYPDDCVEFRVRKIPRVGDFWRAPSETVITIPVEVHMLIQKWKHEPRDEYVHGWQGKSNESIRLRVAQGHRSVLAPVLDQQAIASVVASQAAASMPVTTPDSFQHFMQRTNMEHYLQQPRAYQDLATHTSEEHSFNDVITNYADARLMLQRSVELVLACSKHERSEQGGKLIQWLSRVLRRELIEPTQLIQFLLTMNEDDLNTHYQNMRKLLEIMRDKPEELNFNAYPLFALLRDLNK